MDSAVLSMDSESEFIVQGQPSQPRWRKAGLFLAGAAGLVGLAGLAGAAGAKYGVESSMASFMNKEERIDIIPSAPACATAKEDCSDSACCQVSGHQCFTKKTGAQCNATCTSGKQGFTCNVISKQSVPVERWLGQSLYCFSVYTKETGAKKENTEPKLLTMQKKLGVSIFACEMSDVFSDDGAAILDSGIVPIKVEDVMGEFHLKKRQDVEDGGYVNWALFYQVWIKVREQGKWESADWTVKVDPDAVFVPQRLRDYLSQKKSAESPHGIYFENCKNVNYGMFGNLEVISNQGTNVLVKYLENCHAAYGPCAYDGCDWSYGPWGEDVFVQRCLDKHYVDKVAAYDITNDGACPADRPLDQKKNKKWHSEDCSQLTTVAAHPFKKPTEYLKCLNEMTGNQYVA